MKFYLLNMGFCTANKNKLQTTYYEMCTEMDRTIFSEEKIDEFKASFLAKVEELNQEFKRCQPIEINFAKGYLGHKKDWYIHANNGVKMEILLSKPLAEDYLTAQERSSLINVFIKIRAQSSTLNERAYYSDLITDLKQLKINNL